MSCERPEETRERVIRPAPHGEPGDGHRWPPGFDPCTACGGPWHESIGHIEVVQVDQQSRFGGARVTVVRRYCWSCTLEMIETIKRHDWSQVPKGRKRSAWPMFNGRPLLRQPKWKAIP